MKTQGLRTLLFVVLFVLSCSAFFETAQAVSPPPDGAYPGGNTAEGQNALLSLTTGTYNTAVGLYSLLSLTDGRFNTAIGAATLLANTADEITACGAGALLSNTTGEGNTANGAFALSQSTGDNNTAVGAGALQSSTTGNGNIALGASAGSDVTTASNVIAIGTSGDDLGNSCFIGQIYTNVQPQVGTNPDLVTKIGRAHV